MSSFDKQEQDAARVAQFIKAQNEHMAAPMFVELTKMIAVGRMIRFKAHLDAGFTEAQALELCKT